MMLRIFILCTFCWMCCMSHGTEPLFAPLVPFNSQHFFTLTNKVTIKEISHGAAEETSYTFTTLLKVNSVWSKNQDQLLQIYFTENRVSTVDKKGKERIQDIIKIPDRPFYIRFEGHGPTKIIAHTYRDQSLLNIERGIASLLQIQYKVGPMVEVDMSGMCNVFYNAKSKERVEKKKTDCSNWDLKVAYRGEKPLDISRLSIENVVYDISPEGSLLQAHSVETHKMHLTAQPEVGTIVESLLTLKHVTATTEHVEQLDFETLEEAVQSLMEWYREFDLEADVDGAVTEYGLVTLKSEINKYTKHLANKRIGHYQLAEAFARLVPLARITKQEEFQEILESHKNILPQLVDLLGATQTFDAHKAINATFQYRKLSDFDLLEKYLQSLAVGTHPEEEIIKDLFAIVKSMDDSMQYKKIKNALVQCMSSLAHHFEREVIEIDIRNYLVENLKKNCGKDEECKLLMIRGLQNLADHRSIETLMGYAFLAEPKLSVAAMKALKRFSVIHFQEPHRLAFTFMFYQSRKKYATSARTMALDILLDMRPTKEELGHMLDYLASNDRHFEIKTYVIQKFQMYAEKHPKFKALLQMCLSERPHINNYHILGQKGFTSVLSRPLSSAPAFNETLLSVQEVHKGVLRHGSVELLLQAGEYEASTFKLGIFTNGLDTFMSNNNDADEQEDLDDDNEENPEYSPITAGMEISVNGVAHRPLIFFTGKSELMTHIWSGTVSESTPAFQGTMLAHDHEHYVMLSSGATAHFNVIGAKSIDLNGKAGFSLWNRNADTEIKQNAATVVYGIMKVGFTYATVTNEFVFSYEPKIVLQAHIDFYDELKLCMRLQRPEMELNLKSTKTVNLKSIYNYQKSVHSKHSHKFPGHTYALNRKNNNMCNMVAKNLEL
ncbi:microsomal triacylglycerol transfer protein [Stomoxys calcitrans]|uniref:microsomal triacylglycerol transfer protein n=1 Tax=Stomoxys calcitrans TaxID=35570 RepID=UPI0027E2E674|nr:microsomal triacylglycerol transfer protein [Stomoxys calcitrans]